MDEITDFEAVAELFKILATPVRLHILAVLDASPKCVHEIVHEVGISQPLASQHLLLMREANLVTGVKRGRETIYSISDDHVTHIVVDAVAHINEKSLEKGTLPCAKPKTRDLHPTVCSPMA